MIFMISAVQPVSLSVWSLSFSLSSLYLVLVWGLPVWGECLPETLPPPPPHCSLLSWKAGGLASGSSWWVWSSPGSLGCDQPQSSHFVYHCSLPGGQPLVLSLSDVSPPQCNLYFLQLVMEKRKKYYLTVQSGHRWDVLDFFMSRKMNFS